MLIDQLPFDSRLKSRLAGDDTGRRWGQAEHLLASVQDLLSIVRIEARVLAGDKRPPSHQPVDRPGAAAAREAHEAAELERAQRLLGRRTTKPRGTP